MVKPMASYSLVHLLGCLLGGSWTDGQMNKQVQQNVSLVCFRICADCCAEVIVQKCQIIPNREKKREIAWKKTRTTSTKSDQQVVPKQGYPKLLKLFHNCLYRADFGGPLYLPFVFFSLSRLGRGTGG